MSKAGQSVVCGVKLLLERVSMRVLVVDDDAAVRDSLSRTLRFEGHEVQTVRRVVRMLLPLPPGQYVHRGLRLLGRQAGFKAGDALQEFIPSLTALTFGKCLG